jgi:hypothetical protein
MKKTLLMMAMLMTANVNAANVTQDLGTIVQGSLFQATHTNEVFKDTFDLNIVPNIGVASAAVNVNLDKGPEFKFTSASLVNVANGALASYTIKNGGAFNSIVATFPSLVAGKYQLLISGQVFGGTATYTGNWQIVPTNTPLPGAVWMFGSSLLAMIGLGGRKVNK